MSQSKLQDLLLFLAGGLSIAGCAEPGSSDPGDVDPEQRDALETAIELCKPYARKISTCYQDATGESDYDSAYNGYVTQVGYCVTGLGYASALGPACNEALEDYFACIAALDCEAVRGELDDGDSVIGGSGESGEPESEPDPCGAQNDQLEVACDFGPVVTEPSPGGSEG